MTQITDLQIICIPTETQDEINSDSTYQELLEFMTENPDDFVTYDLGRYFQDQNSDDLGLHWSFLVDKRTGKILNGKYNSDIEALNNNDLVVLERPNIWSNIDTAFEDEEEGLIYVDAWVGNEEDGQVIAKVNSTTGEVIYIDERAKTDRYAQNMITELVDEIKKNFVHPLN
jgi:hypothetical protein